MKLGAITLGPVLVLVACGGAADEELSAPPTTSTSATEPPGKSITTPPSSAPDERPLPEATTPPSSSPPPPPGPKPATVRCGSSSCSVGAQVCCATWTAQTAEIQCEKQGSCFGRLSIACDDTADCAAGEMCCAYFEEHSGFTSASCKSKCGSSLPGVRSARFCDPAAPGECGPGAACKPSTDLSGYFVCAP
jgi:hypothetical protein